MLSRDESSQQKSEGGESHEKTDSQEGSVLEYNIGTIVLGKIGGYLTWPGWVRKHAPVSHLRSSHPSPPDRPPSHSELQHRQEGPRQAKLLYPVLPFGQLVRRPS